MHKIVRLDKDISNGAGNGISKGTKVEVVSVGRGFTIKTEKCPHCGQFAYIRGVMRDEVTYVEADNVHTTEVGNEE
jgi:hypothetical protein